MDGMIEQLQNLEFDPNANTALNQNRTMNGIIHTLSRMDVSQSNGRDIQNMVSSLNAEINKFILELQNQLYWRFKIRSETKKFQNMPHRDSIDRIVSVLTFYNDHHHNEKVLIEFINDKDADYCHLQTDYMNVIGNNMENDGTQSNGVILMKNTFGILRDYVAQNLPQCQHETCPILKRYHSVHGQKLDVNLYHSSQPQQRLEWFRRTLQQLHCYLLHSDQCGIVIAAKDKVGVIKLKDGGKWYQMFDDVNTIKWVPYGEIEQKQLRSAWESGIDHVFLMDRRYKVEFKRDPTYPRPSGYQFLCSEAKPWKRAVLYGKRDGDGMIGGVPCDEELIGGVSCKDNCNVSIASIDSDDL